MQTATEDLQAIDAKFAPRPWDRWSLAAGILNGRMRARKGAMLDRNMERALASTDLRTALENCDHCRLSMEARKWDLTELWARRRRERSLLNQETQILERQYQRDSLQCEDHARVISALEAPDAAVQEDAAAPA